MNKPIVVGVDGSDSSLLALDRALELGEVFSTDVHVVSAVHLTALYQAGLAVSLMSEPDIEQQISDHVWSKVEQRSDEHPSQAKVVRVDRRGYPPDEIVQYAEEVDAEMVVVGNRGYGPVRSAILGSTSHRVAQVCDRDVLIVRSTAD